MRAEGKDLVTAYEALLHSLYYTGRWERSERWGTACFEARNAVMEVERAADFRNISLLGIHTPESLNAYVDEMCNGTLDWAVEAGKEPYTYHQRMEGQWQEALTKLIQEPGSRQAVISIRRPEDIREIDPPCLTTIQLFLRDNALHMTVYFRSNDAWQATYMNAYALMCLQNRWAQELRVRCGSYIHMVGSLHVYEKDFYKFEAAVKRSSRTPYLAMAAEDFWAAL